MQFLESIPKEEVFFFPSSEGECRHDGKAQAAILWQEVGATCWG